MLFTRSSSTRSTSTPPAGSSNTTGLIKSLFGLGENIYDKVTGPSTTLTQPEKDLRALNFNDDISPPATFGVNEDKDGNEHWYVTD
jgi:hypothetical protein